MVPSSGAASTIFVKAWRHTQRRRAASVGVRFWGCRARCL